MVHIDGVKSEDFFEDFIINNLSNINIKRIHNPFDFIVGSIYIEVKSAKLYVSQSKNKAKFQHGKYEFWNIKQLQKAKKKNVWICFIIQHDQEFIIHGFLKSKYLTNSRVITINSIQKLPLKSKKQFIQYMRMNPANESKSIISKILNILKLKK